MHCTIFVFDIKSTDESKTRELVWKLLCLLFRALFRNKTNKMWNQQNWCLVCSFMHNSDRLLDWSYCVFPFIWVCFAASMDLTICSVGLDPSKVVMGMFRVLECFSMEPEAYPGRACRELCDLWEDEAPTILEDLRSDRPPRSAWCEEEILRLWRSDTSFEPVALIGCLLYTTRFGRRPSRYFFRCSSPTFFCAGLPSRLMASREL